MDKQTAIAQVQGLQENYQANESVLTQLSHLNLIAVVGPSGAGKSTVVRQSGLPFVIGDTTRAQRDGEVQGRDYNFRTDLNNVMEEIEQGEFVQFVVLGGTELYGTKASSFPGSGVCAMPILASSLPSFRRLGFASIVPVYIVPPSNTEWMQRLSAHRAKDLEARLMEAKESLNAALADPSYVFILNDDLSAAVEALRAVARGSVNQTDSARARSAASTLYDRLQRAIR